MFFIGKGELPVVKRRWLLIGLVVGATILIDFTILSLGDAWRKPGLLGLVWFSLAPGQGSLLGLWAALGGKATPWRLVAGFLAAVAGTWILGEPDLAFWVLVLLAQMAAMSGLLLLGRLLGLELAYNSGQGRVEASTAEGQWIQYSLRSLLSWTAACAVLLSAVHYLPKDPLWELSREPAILAAVLVSSATTALGAFWIALGVRWPAVRVVSLALMAGAGVTILRSVVASRGKPLEFFTLCFVQAGYLAGSACLLRLAGYRLVWRRRVRL